MVCRLTRKSLNAETEIETEENLPGFVVKTRWKQLESFQKNTALQNQSKVFRAATHIEAVTCSSLWSSNVQRAQYSYLYMYFLRQQNYLYLYLNKSGKRLKNPVFVFVFITLLILEN